MLITLKIFKDNNTWHIRINSITVWAQLHSPRLCPGPLQAPDEVLAAAVLSSESPLQTGCHTGVDGGSSWWVRAVISREACAISPGNSRLNLRQVGSRGVHVESWGNDSSLLIVRRRPLLLQVQQQRRRLLLVVLELPQVGVDGVVGWCRMWSRPGIIPTGSTCRPGVTTVAVSEKQVLRRCLTAASLLASPRQRVRREHRRIARAVIEARVAAQLVQRVVQGSAVWEGAGDEEEGKIPAGKERKEKATKAGVEDSQKQTKNQQTNI